MRGCTQLTVLRVMITLGDYLPANQKGDQDGTFNTGEDWSEGIQIQKSRRQSFYGSVRGREGIWPDPRRGFI
jgi:hypothetical protein